MIDYSLFETIPGIRAVVLPDPPRFTVVTVSNDFVAATGMARERLAGRGFFEPFPGSQQDMDFTGEKNIRDSFAHVLQHKAPHLVPQQRYDIPNADGTFTKKYWKAHNVPVLSGTGEVRYIIHTAEDITEQVMARQREVRLLDVEKAYNLFLTAPVVIGIVKGDTYVIELANEELLQVWGRTEAVIGKPLLEAIPELQGQGFIELLDEVRRTGKPYYAVEAPIKLARSGTEEQRYMNFVYKAYYEDKADEVASSVIAVGHDVTEQVKARKEIEENRYELQLAIEIGNLGTFNVDWQAKIGTYNSRIKDWFGLTEDTLPMDFIFSVIHPDDRQHVVEAIKRSTLSEENSRHDLAYRVRNLQTGREYHLRSSGKAMFDTEGKAYRIVGVIQDVTKQALHQQQVEENEAELQKRILERTIELEKTNEELRRSNQNLEEFAYAASHDMKEPIRKIHFFADRLKQQLGPQLTEEQSRLFSRMEHAAGRMNTLIEDLLTYSHVSRGVSHRERVDLNQKLKNALEDLEVEIEQKHATITVNSLPTVTVHRRQIQQAFQNLIGNALKYSKPGVPPQVHITSKVVWGRDTTLPLNGDEANKQFHLIEVRDNGIGFAPSDAERIFNMFTRLHGNAEYRGSGVGLSIVRKVVENHQGHIWAESKPGEGAAFMILLPAE